MPWLDTITVLPDTGTFLPTTFQDLLQQRIDLGGLDPRYYHTLVGVQVAEDGSSAQLQVVTEPIDPLNLTRTLRVHDGTPLAHVRVVDDTGTVLMEGQYTAPLQPGQMVAIGADYYLVTVVAWPNRGAGGVSSGAVDWQLVTVTAASSPSMLPSLSAEQPDNVG